MRVGFSDAKGTSIKRCDRLTHLLEHDKLLVVANIEETLGEGVLPGVSMQT